MVLFPHLSKKKKNSRETERPSCVKSAAMMESTRYTSVHHRFVDDDDIPLNAFISYEARRKAETQLRRSEHGSHFGSRAVFTFVQPTEKKKITYREQQARLRRAVQRCPTLGGAEHGCILDTLEKGVAYPVLHANFDVPPRDFDHLSATTLPPVPAASTPSDDFNVSSSFHFAANAKKSSSSDMLSVDSAYSGSNGRSAGKDKDAKKQRFRLLSEDALGSAVHVQQGLYEEVRRIEPDFAHSPRDDGDRRAFILLGFKTLDTGFSSVLESTWRDWTGARAIYLRLHNQFDLSKIVFYHRVSPVNDLDLFMYVVLVECWNVVPSNLINILDFVQRMRVERLNGYISLYRASPTGAGADEADSNYHSASQESEDERWNTSTISRSSASPNPRLEEEDEEYEDQGVQDVVAGAASSRRRNPDSSHHNDSILVTESSSETRTRTRVKETLTIQTNRVAPTTTQPTVKFPQIIP